MAIKIKYREPSRTEFSTTDIIIDVKDGCLYYKDNNHVYKLKGDNRSADVIEEENNYTNVTNTTITNTTTGDTDDPIILSNPPNAPSDGSTVEIGKRDSSTQGTFRIRSSFGHVDIGHANSSFCHFYKSTEGSAGFYFNESISTAGNVFSSHNGNLQLQCQRDTSRSRIVIVNSQDDPLVRVKGNFIAQAHGTSATGTVSAENDVIAFASDKRLKENIIKIPDPLEKIKQLRGVYYDWKKDVKEKGFHPTRKTNEIGMIAQEVEKVIPQAIEPAPFDNEYKTIKYDRIIPLLVECIKDQQKQIDELKSLI